MQPPDENPAKVAKISETTGVWQFTYEAIPPIEITALIHHNLDTGADVRWLFSDADDWETQ